MDRARRRSLAEELVAKILRKRKDVVAIVLTGSVARGDDLPDSDVDLMVFTRQGPGRTQAFILEDTAFHVHWLPWDRFRASMLEPEPDSVRFAFFEGDVLHDPGGRIARLRSRIAALPDAHYRESALGCLNWMYDHVCRAKNLWRRKDYVNLAYVANFVALWGASVVALLNRRHFTNEMAMDTEWEALPSLPQGFGRHFRRCRDAGASPRQRYNSVLALWETVRSWASRRGVRLRTVRSLAEVRIPKTR